jgi:hypothetical protein
VFAPVARAREEHSAATQDAASPQESQSATGPAVSAGAQTKSQSSAASAQSSKKSKQEQKKNVPQAPQPNQSFSGTSQTTRMMWIVPNFAAVSAGVEFHPMTPKQKFWMATEDSFDYSSFAWTGVMAAQSYALDQYPELGTGGAAYGSYYWRGLLDGVSNSYFSEAIVPVLTHEDARYFTMGHGGIFRRLGYALSRVVVTKTDSGRNTFNISEVGGDFASAALSSAYYPQQERGMVKISEGWGAQLESAALNNIAKEFWPDIRKYVFHQH